MISGPESSLIDQRAGPMMEPARWRERRAGSAMLAASQTGNAALLHPARPPAGSVFGRP